MKKPKFSLSQRRSTYKRLKNYQLPEPKNNRRTGQEIVTSANINAVSISTVERKFDTDRDKSSRF